MTTTVHLPADLLASVDRQARELDMSRNRYVIRALERALETETRWSATFVAALTAAGTDVEGQRALEAVRTAIAANRTRKGPPAL